MEGEAHCASAKSENKREKRKEEKVTIGVKIIRGRDVIPRNKLVETYKLLISAVYTDLYLHSVRSYPLPYLSWIS